ncbi:MULTISPECIES: hypothetical protein [Hyphomicrobiales]|uniref:Uncharacterized protein n=3 Tax=Hyphomicrobiales TaxID=356 RepID=A0A974PUV2_9HYPH|nr:MULTISPECIES: hypothetical protein [Hyphomicrobiales]MCR5860121.1 hypothetical protein [Mesorhizobium sp. J428]MCR5860140.1 hypothetical protein [Mesorhizobium sp. J428]MCR5860151.1 hypothetical protein [Mesorhizobium sp. J428]MCR5860169.1 hypothetical protein [Mesorhizobium sp. J428]MCR5860205.1 hypothetical protein [Mesorhizobium sp. J428]
MTKPVRLPRPDPYRKARFREIAREIVAKDRYNRKYGLSVDTAGAIANALERAYREGINGGENRPAPIIEYPDNGPMDWALIPPRPRNAFWSICLFTLSRGDRPARGGRLVPAITERGTSGWMLVVPGHTYEKQFGDKTVAPLVRLGLLEADDDDPAHRVVSKRGEETWSQFVQRGGQFPEDLTNL